MRLFLDTSVVLAACGSATGASREVCQRAAAEGWTLVVTPYVIEEATRNLFDFPPAAWAYWATLWPTLTVMPDVFTHDRPAVFAPAKDRPILFSAHAWADVLLTLDRTDFQDLLGHAFYSLAIRKPSDFLRELRNTNS